MQLKARQFIYSDTPNTCRNCGNYFVGKICNKCGEKVFHEKQLSSGHFFHQIIDFFTHFENKVLRTIWLNIVKPGFVTRENLRGVRVPFANPVQLYLVVSILFYFTVTKIQVSDYTPAYGDQEYFGLSAYRMFQWAEPADKAVLRGIEGMQEHKFEEINNYLHSRFASVRDSTTGLYRMRVATTGDSLWVNERQLRTILGHESEKLFLNSFNSTVSTYSKTFIFVMLPFMAAFLFLFFFRSLRFYGGALILATHFMVYNLCFFIFHCLVDWLPQKFWGPSAGHVLSRPFGFLFRAPFAGITTYFVSGSFEFLHLLFWVPWLYIAFRRLFNKPWWFNLIAAFLCGRIFFFLIFSVLKKLLIAFTIFTMH